MLISGTRGALAVPFAGYALCVILSKNWKIAISTSIILVSAFLFFNFTTIGNDNSLIKRMRSAFDLNDPSLNVRLENQKKLKEYMADIPLEQVLDSTEKLKISWIHIMKFQKYPVIPGMYKFGHKQALLV